jgi:hypothetical protein
LTPMDQWQPFSFLFQCHISKIKSKK